MIDERSQPAFEPLSDSNRGPLIIVTAYIFLLSSFPAVLIKIWTRASTARTLIHTDWLMLVSYAFAIGQTVALTFAVNRGLGRHTEDLSDSELESIGKTFYASSILAIPTLAFAKASVTTLIVSIQARGTQSTLRACHGVLGIIVAWMIASVLALAFQCELPKPWVLGPQTCINQYALRIGVGAIDILTDLAIVGLAFFMMQPVQVSTRKKSAVVAMFGLRAIVPAFAICALVAYHSYYYSRSQDRTWNAIAPSIWTQVAMNLSIITACIPSMKRFLADIQSGLMGATISESYEMTHSSGKPKPHHASSGGFSLGSKLASRLGTNTSQMRSTTRSQSEKGDLSITPADEWYAARAQANSGKMMGEKIPEAESESESVKGLTDNVIHQRIDYQVEYEDGLGTGGESRNSE